MLDKLGITQSEEAGALGVYESPSGIPVFEADKPYKMEDGVSLQEPLPVRFVDGTTYTNELGNSMQAMPVSGVAPPPQGVTWDSGATWDNNTYWV